MQHLVLIIVSYYDNNLRYESNYVKSDFECRLFNSKRVEELFSLSFYSWFIKFVLLKIVF